MHLNRDSIFLNPDSSAWNPAICSVSATFCSIVMPRYQMLDDRNICIQNGDDFLNYICRYLTWTPSETDDCVNVYDMICIFYFVLDQAPLATTRPQSSQHQRESR